MVQPSSVDVRIDRYFRVFENHRYPHIDPAVEQAELTRLVEPDGDEPFILHPGEFVLGSTYEVVSLPDDVSARLEGKALGVATAIPTPSGWTTMGALRVGDEVFGPDGRPRRVVAATGIMTDRPCYEVEFSDHSVIVADGSHQWLTTSKAEREHGRHGISVRTTEQIAASLRVRRRGRTTTSLSPHRSTTRTATSRSIRTSSGSGSVTGRRPRPRSLARRRTARCCGRSRRPATRSGRLRARWPGGSAGCLGARSAAPAMRLVATSPTGLSRARCAPWDCSATSTCPRTTWSPARRSGWRCCRA